MNNYSEDFLVEQPAIKVFAELGYETQNCFDEKFGDNPTLGRKEMNDVALLPRLEAALEKINPQLPRKALQMGVQEILRSRGHLGFAQANKELYGLIKNGIKVSVVDDETTENEDYTVKVVDFNNPDNNNFFLGSQFWIAGEMYKRRADLVGFVNGLPMIFIELKASHKNLKHAFNDNFRDYKSTVPQLFWFNAFVIISNGIETKIGSITSEWEHFNDWKKINNEGEKGVVSMDTMFKGTCEKKKFLDILENFILFDNPHGDIVKVLARNHQFLGVNGAIEDFSKAKKSDGKIGVFWHTQGSGKSISMVFFAQKILRKFEGNYTFVVVTDRQELDGQIYKQFASAGVTTEEEDKIHANSSRHLQELLQEDHRLVFTLIQKFRTERQGEVYPELSGRDDIIVMTDEAHRSQYEVFALNMRNALPKANFIGFTGTPLIKGESEKTKEVFGDYVSVYNFRQSIEDKATVPLYYENRIPELQLKNQDLEDDLEKLIEEAELDEAQEEKLEKEFARQYHLITREDRLEKIAEDIVNHFFNRGERGKAMVVSIDKTTAFRMYDKVQKYVNLYIEKLEGELKGADDEKWEQTVIKLKEAKETDMAVIVSQEQNEIENYKAKGIDVTPHRKRMVKEDMEKKFKDSESQLRIVFVCNMWLTGFDVPSLSTIYLDKPMKNHSLMQAIARANRVFEDKNNGLIVDYIGVFRSLQKALSIYATDQSGEFNEDDGPILPKEDLIEELKKELGRAQEFCKDHRVDVSLIMKSEPLERLGLLEKAVDNILITEESKKNYSAIVNTVGRLFKAILPDKRANEFLEEVTALKVILARIQDLEPKADIDEVREQIEDLLDESIETGGYNITTLAKIDLSQIDFEKLREYFQKKQKNIAVEALKTKLEEKLKEMVKINPSRMKFMEKFQMLLDEYNLGSQNIESLFDKLVALVNELSDEEKRHVSEKLTEEELALFDILSKPDLKDKERKQVKKAVKDLLNKLKWEKLVMDWKKTQQRRASVIVTVRTVLDDNLPRSYEKKIYEQKCDAVYKHLYDSYEGAGKCIYANA
ncbi:type I restriction endonuclease subunit R [Candidatus Peregrinibacteria bacterium]|nr:type I restriction endonuclease subunit R [Candidatus Peregrinibacteria bacterium]